MQANQGILRQVLFSLIGSGSLFALSACGQPAANNTTTPPIAEAPTTTVSPAPVVPPLAATPSPATTTNATANRSLAEIAQLASKQGSFKTLTKAVQVAGLTQQLSTQGPFTVFAPTDAAFASLPPGTVDRLLQPENKQQLIALLSYHVIPGQVTSSQLTSAQVKTVQGSPVNIVVDDTSKAIKVNDALVVQADIPASNGVIHVVDKVILPPK